MVLIHFGREQESHVGFESFWVSSRDAAEGRKSKTLMRARNEGERNGASKRRESDSTQHLVLSVGQPWWDEVGCYGGGVLRGASTPRIDQLAAEGMRLLNFNVEALPV